MALVSAPAFAADMPETFAEAAVAVPSFSWNGAYVGVFAGAGFTGKDVRVTDRDGYQTGAARSFGYKIDDGFTGGVTLGYNVQLDNSPLVFGVEGELGYIDLAGKRTDPASIGGDTRSRAEFDEFYATLTGRVGFAFERFLVFGKAGVAYLDTSARYRDSCDVLACGGGLISARKSGDEFHFTAGGGLEYAFTDQISVKGEYTYINTGETLNASGDFAGSSFRFGTRIPDIHIVKAGLNYRFNW